MNISQRISIIQIAAGLPDAILVACVRYKIRNFRRCTWSRYWNRIKCSILRKQNRTMNDESIYLTYIFIVIRIHICHRFGNTYRYDQMIPMAASPIY